MNVEALRADAMRYLAAAKSEIEERGALDPIIAVHTPGSAAAKLVGWKRLPCPGWIMNEGPAKTAYFGHLRNLIDRTGADACIIVTEMWGMKLTAKGRRHGNEYQRLIDRGFERLLKLGWATRKQVVALVAQTRTDVILANHEFQRNDSTRTIRWLSEAHVEVWPQDGYGGRTKMFGVGPDSDLGEPPEGSYADRHNRGEDS